MTDTKLSNIILLADDSRLNGGKLKKICDKMCDIIDRDDERMRRVSIGRAIDFSRFCVLGIRGVYHECIDFKIKEKVATKLFGVSRDKVTGNLATFIHSEQNFSILVDDIRYGAEISKKKLEHLKAIWGSVDLCALDDLKYLQKLKVVMGDIRMSSKNRNLDMLNNLEVVTGNVYADGVDGMLTLPNLKYVGGNIYNNGNVYTLDGLKNDKKQFVKK